MCKRIRLRQLEKLGWGVKEISELLEELKVSLEANDSINKMELNKEQKIISVINGLGIPFNVKGREYIIQGIKYALKHEKFRMTIELYPYISEKLKVTQTSVERAMINAIKFATERKSELFYSVFGASANKNHITNKEFICAVVSYLKFFEK